MCSYFCYSLLFFRLYTSPLLVLFRNSIQFIVYKMSILYVYTYDFENACVFQSINIQIQIQIEYVQDLFGNVESECQQW